MWFYSMQKSDLHRCRLAWITVNLNNNNNTIDAGAGAGAGADATRIENMCFEKCTDGIADFK